MFKFIFAFLSLITFTTSAFAIGSIIAAEVIGGILVSGGTLTIWGTAVAFAINMVASTIISKAFFSPQTFDPSGMSANLGNRQQLAPATNNKLPIVYGTAYVGGTGIDLSISQNNQEMYYVLALCEVTGTGSDTISFGDIYYSGKKVAFDTDGYTVASLTDESTGVVDTTVAGKIQIFLYNNGSNNPVNSTLSAIDVMQSAGLTYTWDSNKLMSNCVFAIVHLTYSQKASISALQQTRFQIINTRTNTGDVIYDYLTNTIYGCAIPTSQIDTASLADLTSYSNQTFYYTPNTGGTGTIPRFKFDGVIDTSRIVMDNLQDMASCCDCLIKYNEITGKWGTIVQTPSYSVALALNDSNIVSAIQITPLDIAASYNIAEVQFPDKSQQDAFNTAIFDLAEIAPSLLYPNEPVNKQTINLPLVNNDVRAQYLATRFLKSCREDLQVQVQVDFSGLQLEAGDVVTLTNSNYGWVNKLFRIGKCVQNIDNNGIVTVSLTLMEYNPSVYNDAPITQFATVPNTGLGDPTFFGTLTSPAVISQYPVAATPTFSVRITSSSSGITQYAELWYSAYASPTSDQMLFAGTTEIQANGNPYDINTSLPLIYLTDIPAGNWYFFSRMVNSLGSSIYSPPSTLFQWRPMTFRYPERYLAVAYGTSNTGAGFDFSPAGKTYFGISNQTTTVPSSNPSDYVWYPATFGSSNYLLYCTRGSNAISYGVGGISQAAGSGRYVPIDAINYDISIWNGLPTGTNIIDLSQRTGQLIQTGTTTVGTGEIAITNDNQGQIIASLAQLLDFGTGVYQKTFVAGTITADIYGRIVGIAAPDSFYYSMTAYSASSGQTVFSVSRGAGYVTGNCLVFENGLILNPSEYTDNSGNVTFGTGRTAGDIITIISMKSINSSTFATYNSFTRNAVSLSNQASYTASGFTLNNGYEFMFLNGVAVMASDYNITGQTITFNSAVTGDLEIIQWSQNNLNQPNGNPVNLDVNTVIGQSNYNFSFDPNAFNLYNNGVMQLETVDYSVTTGSYTLATSPTSTLNVLGQQTFSRTGAV